MELNSKRKAAVAEIGADRWLCGDLRVAKFCGCASRQMAPDTLDGCIPRAYPVRKAERKQRNGTVAEFGAS